MHAAATEVLHYAARGAPLNDKGTCRVCAANVCRIEVCIAKHEHLATWRERTRSEQQARDGVHLVSGSYARVSSSSPAAAAWLEEQHAAPSASFSDSKGMISIVA